MSRLINLRRAGAAILIAFAAACAGPSNAVGPNTKAVDAVSAIGPNTGTVNGVSSSPSVQGVGTSPRPQP